jgi:hypothetical protein
VSWPIRSWRIECSLELDFSVREPGIRAMAPFSDLSARSREDRLFEMTKMYGQCVVSLSTVHRCYIALAPGKMTLHDGEKPRKPLNSSPARCLHPILDVEPFASSRYIGEKPEEPKDGTLRPLTDQIGWR